MPIETKESYRWLENLRQSIALVGAPDRCVHVGDRESDIYELYCTAQDLGTSFLVRVQTNRPSGLPMLPRTIWFIASSPNLRRRLGRDLIALWSIRTRRPG